MENNKQTLIEGQRFIEIVRTMLVTRPANIKMPDIEEKTGISVHWLHKFRKEGAIPNPGAQQLIALYNFLSKKNLEF